MPSGDVIDNWDLYAGPDGLSYTSDDVLMKKSGLKYKVVLSGIPASVAGAGTLHYLVDYATRKATLL